MIARTFARICSVEVEVWIAMRTSVMIFSAVEFFCAGAGRGVCAGAAGFLDAVASAKLFVALLVPAAGCLTGAGWVLGAAEGAGAAVVAGARFCWGPEWL
jgi:hypothetical protein